MEPLGLPGLLRARVLRARRRSRKDCRFGQTRPSTQHELNVKRAQKTEEMLNRVRHIVLHLQFTFAVCMEAHEEQGGCPLEALGDQECLPLGSYYLDFKTQWPCWRHFLLVRIWEELFDRPSAIHLFMLWLFIAAALYISHLLSRAFISSFRPCCYFAFCRARCSSFNLVQLFLVKNTVITEKEISRQQPDTFFLFQHTCKKRNNSKWCSNVTPVRLKKC